jgi:acyl-[acyl carrier protein]--UDP-N-acetylglucosamine O-acyltransferase
MNSSLDVVAASSLHSTLQVKEAASLESTLQVVNAATMNSSLDVVAASSLHSTLQVKEAASLESTLQVVNAATMNSSLHVTGNVNLANNLIIQGNLTVHGTETIINTTTLAIEDNKIELNTDGDLEPFGIYANVANDGGNITLFYEPSDKRWEFNRDLYVSGNLIVSDSATIQALDVIAASSLHSTLQVKEAASLESTLQVVNAATMNSSLDVVAASSLHSTLQVKEATSLESTLQVVNAATMNSSLDVVAASSLHSTLQVKEAASLESTLQVINAATMNSSLDVVAASSLHSTLQVKEAASLESTLQVINAATMNSSLLDVVAASSLHSTLQVKEAASLESTLQVINAATMNSSLDVVGATSLHNILEVAANITAPQYFVKDNITGNSIELVAPDLSNGSYKLTLPSNDGDANQILQTNGSGILTWITPDSSKTLKANVINNVDSTTSLDAEIQLPEYTMSYNTAVESSTVLLQHKIPYESSIHANQRIKFKVSKTVGSDPSIDIGYPDILGPNNATGGTRGIYISNIINETIAPIGTLVTFTISSQLTANTTAIDSSGNVRKAGARTGSDYGIGSVMLTEFIN